MISSRGFILQIKLETSSLATAYSHHPLKTPQFRTRDSIDPSERFDLYGQPYKQLNFMINNTHILLLKK